MQALTRYVKDIGPADKWALEHALGQGLADNQRLEIRVTEMVSQSTGNSAASAAELPEWFRVFEGLTDQEIDDIDRAIQLREDVTRSYGRDYPTAVPNASDDGPGFSGGRFDHSCPGVAG